LDFGLKRPKKPKMSLKRLHDNNKFCILDGTKHDPENFGILHFITPKILTKRQLFFILDFGLKRQKKKPKEPQEALMSHEGNKFCILDGTKHDSENFGILHFIIPK